MKKVSPLHMWAIHLSGNKAQLLFILDLPLDLGLPANMALCCWETASRTQSKLSLAKDHPKHVAKIDLLLPPDSRLYDTPPAVCWRLHRAQQSSKHVLNCWPQLSSADSNMLLCKGKPSWVLHCHA